MPCLPEILPFLASLSDSPESLPALLLTAYYDYYVGMYGRQG